MGKNIKPNANAKQVNNNLFTVYSAIIKPTKNCLTVNPNSAGFNCLLSL
jgi:hypothetical protein